MAHVAKRLMVWALGIGILLSVPLIAMQFSEGVQWDLFDFVIMGSALFSVALLYEFIARRSEKTLYRAAFGVGLLGAFLLFWVNGAVGLIGSENNPANLLYVAVFVTGFIGTLLAWFKPSGMAWTLGTAALVQFCVPLFALFVWPAGTTWGAPGVFGVFILNLFFVLLFTLSAILFWRSRDIEQL